MSTDQVNCDRKQIQRCLAGQLSPDELAGFEAHVEACPTCQSQLIVVAADESWWTEVGGYLSDDDLDVDATNCVEHINSSSQGGEIAADVRPPEAFVDFLDPTDDPRMLGRFGGYEIAGIVGQGGMGIVLKGFDLALNRYVAIKVLAPHLAASGSARQRFAREAQAAAAVVHDHVIAIHAVAQQRHLPYLIMPYVRGESLQRRLDDWGPLQVVEILRIAMQVASGLAAAHAQGLVHRDIKPANILLEKGVERVTITDFGLARAADDASLTHTGMIAGTPQFMSPEQARGELVDHRSDLYSLGSLLYTMCTGQPPFRGESVLGVLRQVSESTICSVQEVAPDIPPWLSAIVEQLHAKDPGQRFSSADEVANLLEHWLAHLQQPQSVAPPKQPGWSPRAIQSPRTRPMRLLLAPSVALGVLCLVGLLVGWAGLTNKPQPSIPPHATAKPPSLQSPRSPGSEVVDAQVVDVEVVDVVVWEAEVIDVREKARRIEEQWASSPAVADEFGGEIARLRDRIQELSRQIRQP